MKVYCDTGAYSHDLRDMERLRPPSECEAFLTSDKGDIVAHAEKLQTMLGMKVFHVPNQWADFVVYVRARN